MDYKDEKPIKAQHEYLDPRDYRSKHLQDFLKKISMLESSGGKDTKHKKMQKGLQKGDTAVGEYGLMPNTMEEMSNRYPSEVTNDLSKEELRLKALSDPNFANTMAGTMADYLKNERGLSDDEAAAAWEAGHNKPVEKLNLNTKRAKKFKVLSGK